MTDFGYIAAKFENKEIIAFQKLVKKICKQDGFYYSDVVDYIKGDVTEDLHLTIFYGLIDNKIDKVKLNRYIRGINPKTLKLEKCILVPGYKDLYQSLRIGVLDKDKNLQTISDSFKKFAYEKSVQLEFEPHLTLAYVKPDFKLSSSCVFPKKIKIKEIKYFEK